MKALVIGAALAWVCCLTMSPVVLASGRSGQGGGGHSGGGGHAGGGHAATGGHASAGHAGGQTHAGATSQGTAAPRGGGTTVTTSPTSPTSTGSTGSRPRTGQPVVGTAVPRTSIRPTPPVISPFVYSLRRGWPYYGSALGFGGFGLYTNPFWSGYRYGYPGLAYTPDTPWPYIGYSTYSPYPFDGIGPTGGLRLKVEPKEAQVYVDGYYAGIVDDFNGHFQHLDLTPGPHHVELRRTGYEPVAFDVSIQPHHTIEYRGALPRSIP